MGMKFACQHLLCRRDLSCTKVNAVNRLSNCLERASDQKEKRWLLQWLAPPRSRAQPVCSLALGELWADQGRHRDAALQMLGVVSMCAWSAEGSSGQLPAGSAVFP